MQVKPMPDDQCVALVSDNPTFVSGYEIHRSGFTSQEEALKAREEYAKTGKWPNHVKSDSEVDL